MSRNKFAAITSSLLARKGEAAPWQNSAPMAWMPTIMPAITKGDPPFVTHETKPPAPTSDALKKCTVRLTQHEYERLGILAVKKNLTRQQLLQAALVEVLGKMAQTCAPHCECLNGCIRR